jgi:hypothetical protein
MIVFPIITTEPVQRRAPTTTIQNRSGTDNSEGESAFYKFPTGCFARAQAIELSSSRRFVWRCIIEWVRSIGRIRRYTRPNNGRRQEDHLATFPGARSIGPIRSQSKRDGAAELSDRVPRAAPISDRPAPSDVFPPGAEGPAVTSIMTKSMIPISSMVVALQS